MKEQTFFIEKLDSGFLMTTSGKQHAAKEAKESVVLIMKHLSYVFDALVHSKEPISAETTITHKVHYKSAEPNDDNAGNHGV